MKEKSGECSDMLGSLNLTEEQKTKFAALKANCDKDGCTEGGYTKFMQGAEKILTAEQFAKLKEHCGKMGKMAKGSTGEHSHAVK